MNLYAVALVGVVVVLVILCACHLLVKLAEAAAEKLCADGAVSCRWGLYSSLDDVCRNTH